MLLDQVQVTCSSCLNVRVCKKRRHSSAAGQNDIWQGAVVLEICDVAHVLQQGLV